MRNLFLLFTALLLTSYSFAGNAKYYEKMGQTLAKFSECKSIEDYQTVGNQFKIIANVESSEWLPLYYHAQCYILMSFMDQDASKRDSYLDTAEKSIEQMLELAPREAEAHALKGFYFTGRLVVDPQNRGQQYGPLSAQSIGMALGIEPENPRAQFLKLSNEKGTAEFFGKDTQIYCDQAVDLLENWDNYKLKSKLHPQWGKAQVQGIVNACGK